MASVLTVGEAVARIAYLSSDVVISVQPSLATETEFSRFFAAFSANKASGVVSKSGPELLRVRHNTDPLLSAFQPARSGKLVTVSTPSSVLIKSIPHLYKLAQYPIVIHAALQPSSQPDYSDVTSIRQSGFIFLQSESLQEAQDIALTAHALAVKSGKGVIHFFDADTVNKDAPIQEEDRTLVSKLLGEVTGRTEGQTPSEDESFYITDGRLASKQVIASAEEAIPVQSTQASAGVEKSQSQRNSDKDSSVASSTPERRSSSDAASAKSSSAATSVESFQSKPISSDDIDSYTTQIWSQIESVTGRKYQAFEYSGPLDAETALFVFGSDTALFGEEIDKATASDEYQNAAILTPRLYRPWLGQQLIRSIPKSVKRIAVLEQVRRKTTKWGPLFLDVLTALKSANGQTPLIVGHQLGSIEPTTVTQALRGIFQNLKSGSPIQNLEIGRKETSVQQGKEYALTQPASENAYIKILRQTFNDRLYIANRLGADNAGVSSDISSNPEYGFGSLLARLEHRARFTDELKEASKSNTFATDIPNKLLSEYLLATEKSVPSDDLAKRTIAGLSTDGSSLARKLLGNDGLFHNESQWLIGSDAWAYDLGNSGVHHVLASGKNINMLVIDSQPYSERAAADGARRKKDIGLYAMNYGNAYVASVAVYSSYTQVLQAMIEAEKFDGPSVIVAYLPYHSENDSPLTVMQETKKAVDTGYWPLYRWDPEAETRGEENFQLDSERVKQELKAFLARDNHLTHLMRKSPKFHASLSESYGSEVRKTQKRLAKDAYSKLLDGLAGAPLTVLFASDGGNAESVAKRLGTRGKARGLKSMVMAMDDYPIEDISHEENLLIVTSTAGQGEIPQNGRNFWDTIKSSTDIDLAGVNFGVFALGDSHYWPRKEDKIYYNKPGKDLHARFVTLGATAFVDVGLGDDQDPDGYQTAYVEWEPKVWDALGVGNVAGLPEEPAPMTNEDIKIQSNFLRGTIAEGLKDESTGALSAADQQLTKFHGTYMQDDRDLRDERKAQGLEPAYSFMIRCRLPGGVATPDQWLQMDAISDNLGNETMKLTTRQTFQFHGIVKGKLKPAMQAINAALMTTIAACGDVNRNVMCSSLPTQSQYHKEVHAASKLISDHLLPSTTAYHEIWLTDDDDKKTQVAGDAVQDFEPMYGPTYLPRKFKITIAIPPHNDTDVYAHDVGLIAIKGEDGHLAGFNVLAGGGMGVTHSMKKTYPRTGSMMGYVEADQVHIACEKIMLVQRDNGDRKNRKHARLKYTVDDMGVDKFRAEVEKYWGRKFHEAKPFKFDSNIDTFGWQKDETGLNHFTMFIENGRIEDTADFPMKTGLKAIAKLDKGEFRLTGNQHLILSNIKNEDLEEVKALMKQYKLDNTNFSGLRLSSSACVAFPTCGLAMAESERYLPELVTKLEGVIEESGLRQESIVMRMTGCPNGCARPWLAEVAFVGKSYGAYNMYLGGGYHGNRLNKLFRSSIKEEEILAIMKPLIKRYATERNEGEHFGDFCIRAGVIKPTTEGKFFHADTPEEEEEDEVITK